MNNITPEERRTKKKAVITKFYGGERKASYHNFDEERGICKTCGEFIGDARTRMCSVITPDEVANFNLNDNDWN